MPNIERLLFEARRYARRQKFNHALKLYQQVLDAEPRHLDALLGKGGCHYKLEELILARAAWEDALRMDPRNPKAREFIARLGDAGTCPAEDSTFRRRRRFTARLSPPSLRRCVLVVLGTLTILALAAIPFVVRNMMRSDVEPSDGAITGADMTDTVAVTRSRG